jgi:rhodanese-related sulfurtransferase
MNTRSHKALGFVASLAFAIVIAWFGWHRAEEQMALTTDFGVVPINAFKDETLTLTNNSDSAWQIVEPKPLCTCLRTLDVPREVPARGKAVFRVRFTPEKLGNTRPDLQVTLVKTGGITTVTDYHFVAEVIPQPEALPSAEQVKQAQGWLKAGIIQPAAAAVAQRSEERAIIDVRPIEEFQIGTPAGALHLPLSALASLPATMRAKPAWLVDRGLGSEAIITIATRLRAEGWKELRIMEGGLAGWRASGGQINGNIDAQARTLTSSEARLSATRPGWITAMPSTLVSNWRLTEIFPDNLTFDPKASPADIAKELTRKLATRRPGEGSTTTVLHLLIATESGEQADLIAQAMQEQVATTPVFVLGGGLRGYLEHLRTLHPDEPHHSTTLANYRGVLADLRTRQRLVASCSSCSR